MVSLRSQSTRPRAKAAAAFAIAGTAVLLLLLAHAGATGTAGRALASRVSVVGGGGEVVEGSSADGRMFEDGSIAAAEPGESGRELRAAVRKAAHRAARGGVAGSLAGALQVLAFMWLRTAMNVQYARGGGLRAALRTLWREGAKGQRGASAALAGVARLYRGIGWAMVQAPLSRFGDTAANEFALSLAAGEGRIRTPRAPAYPRMRPCVVPALTTCASRA